MRLPYPGLRPFRHDESDLFFGREGCVDQMVDRLAATRFLAVLGPSGSGKSSLVLTGLLDALEIGLCARAGSRWQIAYMRPENRPVEKLARALLGPADKESPISNLDVELLASYLRRGPRSIVEWYTDGNIDVGTNLLILVDQFEELFRYSDYAGREEAEAFVALLAESAQSANAAIYVTITMRSEYLGACALVPGLTKRINAGLYLVPRMTREEVREAITGPAAVCGFTIEPALVNRLLNDLENLAPWEDDPGIDQLQRLSGRADQLPLMQHVLNRMWLRAAEAKGDGPIELRVADYDQVGALTGALDAHAREVFESLAETDRPLVETMFRALVSGTTIENAVRRPCRFGDLVVLAKGDGEGVRRVVDAFRGSECNFLTPSQDIALKDDTVIDISHESLIRQWSALRDWVREEFESAQRYQHLETSAQLWAKGEAGLLRRPDLDVALDWRRRERPSADWAARYGGDWGLALRFLNVSTRRRTLRRSVAALVGLLIIGSSAFGATQYYMKPTQFQQDLQKARTDLRNLADESTDFGVPPQDTLQSDVGKVTPLTIPGASEVSTKDLGQIADQSPPPVWIDALADAHALTIPTAVRIPFAGRQGDWTDSVQHRLQVRLDNLTNNNHETPLIFFCIGPRCWESYNASLRALHAGYNHVYWYRGGLSSWQEGEYHLQDSFEKTQELKDQLSKSKTIPTKQRWALAVSLSEIGEIDELRANTQNDVNSVIYAEERGRDELKSLTTFFPDNVDLLSDIATGKIRLASAYEKHKMPDLANAAYGEISTIQHSLAMMAEQQSGAETKLSDISRAEIEIGDGFYSHEKLQAALGEYRDAVRVAKTAADQNAAEPKAKYDIHVSSVRIGALAYKFVLAKDFDKAVEAADFAISLSPETIWMQMNRAHALMFLGKVDEAREIYLQFRGKKIQGDRLWEDDVKNDFAELRKHELTHPLMDEIETAFQAS